MRPALLLVLLTASGALALSACGGDDDAPEEPPRQTVVTAPADPPLESAPSEQRYPDVVDATATLGSDGGFRVDVTISSPYDTPERYADAWRVLGPDGTVYGTRELLHDHAAEQPFTRSLDGVAIPAGVDVVTIEARDLVNGWGGATLDIELSREGR